MTLYLASPEGLNNITIDGRKVGVAFRPKVSSPLASVRFYMMWAGTGYAGGTLGRYLYEIYSDNAGKPGVVIATGFQVVDPQYPQPSNNKGGFPLIAFPSFPELHKGTWYHFIITNVDLSPKTNFSSFNALLSGVKDPTGKFYVNPDPDSFIEYSDATGTTWQKYKEGGTGNEMMASPFGVFFANGEQQGIGGYQLASGASTTQPSMPLCGSAYGFGKLC